MLGFPSFVYIWVIGDEHTRANFLRRHLDARKHSSVQNSAAILLTSLSRRSSLL